MSIILPVEAQDQLSIAAGVVSPYRELLFGLEAKQDKGCKALLRAGSSGLKLLVSARNHGHSA